MRGRLFAAPSAAVGTRGPRLWQFLPRQQIRAVRCLIHHPCKYRGGLLQICAGSVVAFWLPHRVPDTPGSPAALVGMLVFWIVGGLLLYVGAVSLVAAAFARKPAPEVDCSTGDAARRSGQT